MGTISVARARSRGYVLVIDEKSTTFKHYKKIKESADELVRSADQNLLNPIQYKMYLQLIKGSHMYTQQELLSFTDNSLEKIIRKHQFAMRVFNALKLKVLYEPYNKLLLAMFQHIKKLDDEGDLLYSDYKPKEFSLKKLGITTKMVCEEFIKYKLLPDHFFEINEQNLRL